MGIVSKRLRESAKGQDCTLQFPGVCNSDPETTVLAHLPNPVKGTGNKGDDWHAVFACSACHAHMDGYTRPAMQPYQLKALRLTQKYWVDNGYLTVAGDTDAPTKRKTTKLTPPPRRLFREME